MYKKSTLPCIFAGSKREPGSTCWSGELYLPVKNPPPTESVIMRIQAERVSMALLTGVELVETDAVLAQAREELRLYLPKMTTSASLVWLHRPQGSWETDL